MIEHRRLEHRLLRLSSVGVFREARPRETTKAVDQVSPVTAICISIDRFL
jgi:hypothetical protein